MACVLGVLSISCLPGLLSGLPAIILGGFELKAVQRGEAPRQNRIFAWIGIGFSSVGTVASLALAVWLGLEAFRGLADFLHGLAHSKWF